MPLHRPAIIHTSVDSEATGMPSSRARSGFSAEARTAIPTRVRWKNNVSAMIMPAPAMTTARWLPLKTTPPISALAPLNGVGRLLGGIDPPVSHCGR